MHPRRLWVLSMGAGLVGCLDDDASGHVAVSVLEVSGPEQAVVSSEADRRARDAVVASPRHLVSVRDDALRVYDLGGAPLDYGLVSPVSAAALLDDALVVATPAGLVSLDGTALPQALRDAVPLPVLGMHAVDDAIWLQTGQGIFVWRDSELVQLMIDGEPAAGPMAVAPPRSGLPPMWVAHEERVLGLSNDLERVDWFPIQGPIGALAVDGTGAVWVAHEAGLTVRGEGWIASAPLQGAFDVRASAQAANVWVATYGAAYVGDTQGLRPVSLAPGRWAGVDALGSLLLVGDDGLTQVSTAASVSLLELPEGLVDVAEVVVGVTRPGTVESVEVAIGEQILDLPGPPFAFELDASVLDGVVEVSATARWSDGEQARAEGTVFAAAGASWSTGVQPLAQRLCLACHGQGEPIELTTQEQWIDAFDPILTEVESGRMPVGSAPLDASEIGLLKAWRAAGFQ